MKAPLFWLKDFVADLPTGEAGAQKIADALTLGGLPVEHIDVLPNGDRVLDVEVTSNRADCLSIVGVAREIAALLGLKFSAPQSKAPCIECRRHGHLRQHPGDGPLPPLHRPRYQGRYHRRQPRVARRTPRCGGRPCDQQPR